LRDRDFPEVSPSVINKMTLKNESFLLLVLLLLCFLLFFFHLGARPLWDRDEGEHASTSKEMLLSGDWVTPKLNGENFYDKPVLHYWFVAVSFLLFGITEFAARLPAALLGLGGVLITCALGRRMFGPTAGFLAGVILATSPEYYMLSRTVVHDISLVFFITLALFFFYQGFHEERHRKRSFLLFYASLGFAVLAKGPVGIVLPALIVGLFLILTKRLGFLREMEMGWGLLIFLAVAAPWYVLVSARNADYGSYFFIKNNVMRFLSPRAQHRGPLYYYFPALFGGLFPWSCFLPMALIGAFRGLLRKENEARLFLVLWVLVTFLFFSIARSKLSTYILPLFPAVSLLVGGLWSDLWHTPTPELQKGFVSSVVPVLGILLAGLLYLWLGPPLRLQTKFGVDVVGKSYLVLWMLGGIALSLSFLLRKRVEVSFMTLAGTMVSILIFVDLAVLPSINPYLSTRDLVQGMDRMVPAGEKLAYFPSLEGAGLFYTDRRALVLKTPQELKRYLSSDQRVFCMISRNWYYEVDGLQQMSTIVASQGYKLIISNK
jgi:4-amino-4-deoxy-L-arabinose transferase-like glycosyltransferase